MGFRYADFLEIYLVYTYRLQWKINFVFLIHVKKLTGIMLDTY